MWRIKAFKLGIQMMLLHRQWAWFHVGYWFGTPTKVLRARRQRKRERDLKWINRKRRKHV